MLICLSSVSVSTAADVSVVKLRCEYQENALAIEVLQPRLSWQLQSENRGVRQSAYRVLVSESKTNVENGQGDVWDSGKVESDRSIHVPYDGKELTSGKRYWWSVRVWDEKGRASAWAEACRWDMGLLEDSDWSAKWISWDEEEPYGIGDAGWIWHPEGKPNESAAPGTCYFRKSFSIDSGARIRSAHMFLAADNTFVLYANGREVDEGGGWETLRKADLSGVLHAGENTVTVAVTNGAESPNPAGWIGRIVVEMEDGGPAVFSTGSDWKSSKEKIAGWNGVGFDDSGWASALRIGPADSPPWHAPAAVSKPLPIFRREFTARSGVKRAVAYICGLGFYELHLNGRKVGGRLFDPGWTNYRKTCLYAAYDLTDSLVEGGNAFGVMLGNGMYNVPGGRYVKFRGSFGNPKFIMQVYIEYEDGTSSRIVSDGSWRCGDGPVRFSCIFGGEDYDARLERAGWDEADFEDEKWSRAAVCDGPGGRLVPQYTPAIRVMREFSPVAVAEPEPGIHVYDLGQNFSGIPWIRVRGERGSTVRITPGELVNEKGLVTQAASGGPHYYSYTLKGGGEEEWRPRFTYYGFRYLQVEDVTGQREPGDSEIEILEIKGLHTRNSADLNGSFSCSNKLLNRIHALIDWSIASNLQSVLTDCPHREKLGWLEVAHLMAPSIMSRYDAPLFYRKVVRDMSESQLENGLVPDIAPEYVVFGGGFRDSPEWGSACAAVPWLAYQWYGDERYLERAYPTMKKYVDYLKGTSKNLIVSHGLGDWFDYTRGSDVGESRLTPKSLTATAVFYHDAVIVAKTAALLGFDGDARSYSQLAEQVRAAFNGELFDPGTNSYATGSQTANAMPLALGLVDETKRAKVFANLAAEAEERDYITAGDVGFFYLIQALSEGGRNDLVYRLVNRTDPPGYGYQLEQGATSLTEAWDGRRVVSHNHCMLGHAFGWFYRELAGIQTAPGALGFKKIRIEPFIADGLTSAEASYGSMYGTIESSWEIGDGKIVMRVTVPGNTAAEVWIPCASLESVLESGEPVGEADGVTDARARDGAVVCEVGSGQYEFVGAFER